MRTIFMKSSFVPALIVELLLWAGPLEVRVEVFRAGRSHLEFAAHDRLRAVTFEVVDEPELWL